MSKGYRGTTTDEIARRAGLTKGALYHHFDSKEDILLELVKAIAEKNRTALENRLTKKVSPVEYFRLALDMHCNRDVHEYGDVVDIWVQAWRAPKVRRYIAGHLRRALGTFTNRIDASLVPDKARAADLGVFIFSLVHGISGLRLLYRSGVDLDAQVKIFEAFFDKTTRGDRKRGFK